MRAGNGGRGRERGFTYIATLIALALFGIGLAALGQSWSAASQRDKEEELIYIGKAYVRAIGSYYTRSPGSVKKYPATLSDLLEDTRFAGTERHLRRIYRDPLTNAEQWGVVRAPDGGIMGVYSLSEKVPLRRQPLHLANAAVVSGPRYMDWQFIFQAHD
jgi:type II secretory pathway pseudopilin PulG